jgi:hypothetical protein
MISGGAVPNLYASAVYIVGARRPGFARGMGFIPVSTFEEAMNGARRFVGANPNVLCTPRCFTSGTAVHLHLAGDR